MPAKQPPLKIGFIPANRGFFSQTLAAQMRQATIKAMESAGLQVVVPSPEMTKIGCVENRAEAEIAAALFRKEDVRGIIIGAVNFGDEQGAAWAVRQARLNVPIFIFGCQEEAALKPGMDRRDAFCGLLSIGEALRQIGARYTTGTRPICKPSDNSFARDITQFAQVCRIVHGIKNARYAQIGARPDAFWTCRFDEKMLQRLGPTTVVMDLSEVFAGVSRLKDSDPDVTATVADIQQYADTSAIDASAMGKIAKLEVFLKRWGKDNGIDAFGVQCWTSIQQNLGICGCTTMSRLGDQNIAAACEADILGTLSMHACLLASGTPAALADWNNLHNDDDELVNVWHCGVFPRSFARSQPKLSIHGIIVSSGAAPAANSQGTVEMVVKASPLTLFRVTQDADRSSGNAWKAVVAQGQIEDNTAATSGSYGWCRIKNLQSLYRNILLRHFPHHVAITQAYVGEALWEAFGNYLDFQVYHADQGAPGRYDNLPKW